VDGKNPSHRTSGNGKSTLFHEQSLGNAGPDEIMRFILSHGGRTDERQPGPRQPRRNNGRKNGRTALRFIDLFCGIGGFRLAFERAGAKCVFSSDWDRFSRQTYAANFGEEPAGDINTIPVESIPPFDILCGGFPCQPFSLAGVSKKNSLGRKHGFEDERQGNLFFSIAAILAHHQPAAFVLENVKHLLRHDKGRTFTIIKDTLERELGYQVQYKVIDAASVVPQHRERIFMVGFKTARPFAFPKFPAVGPTLASILEKRVPEKYTLTDHLWEYLQNYARKHQAAGNGFGFGLVTPRDVARTLSARYHKDGSEILISQGKRRNPRRLTPRECANLMGYPKDFRIPVSDTQAYRQFGNSVVVPVVERIAMGVVKTLNAAHLQGHNVEQELFARQEVPCNAIVHPTAGLPYRPVNEGHAQTILSNKS
jgi:DNA (cytosine-5)-methyltransferase 1